VAIMVMVCGHHGIGSLEGHVACKVLQQLVKLISGDPDYAEVTLKTKIKK